MSSLTDQIEFANVILLNKTDIMPAETVDRIETIVKTLNPYVSLYEYSKGADSIAVTPRSIERHTPRLRSRTSSILASLTLDKLPWVLDGYNRSRKNLQSKLLMGKEE